MAPDRESIIGRECRWRWTAQTPRFLGLIDSRALAPFLLLLFWTRLWVLYLALGTTAFFVVLQMFRVSPIAGIRGFLLYCVTFGFRRSHLGHRRQRPSRSASFD